MQLLLQQYRAMFDNAKDPAYIRVLAFNDRGRELLKEMQDSAQLPVIIKLGRNVLEKYGEKVEQQLSVDIAATNLTDTFAKEPPTTIQQRLYCLSDLYSKIIKQQNKKPSA